MIKFSYFTHNWLAAKINNTSFIKNRDYIKGIVIDLGCGNSPFKNDILKKSTKYYGLDWKNSLHDLSNLDVLVNLNSEFPIKNNSVDTVTAFQVMEHICEPDNFLKECYRILKNKSHLFLTLPFMWHIHEAPFDYFRYTRYGLEYLLKKHGFSEIFIEEVSGYWQMSVLKFNYYTKKIARGPIKYVFIPIWYMGQTVSPLLDKLFKHPNETAGYIVVAKKL